MNRRRFVLAVAISAVSLLWLPSARGVPGDYDGGYGSCGSAPVDAYNGVSNDAVVQDDEIVTAGSEMGDELADSRLTVGSVDANGDQFRSYTHTEVSEGTAVATHPADTAVRALVGGIVSGTAAIAGVDFDPVGLDTGWASDGVAELTGAIPVTDLAVDSGGKVYAVAGDQVFRRNANGAADTTWASDGSLTVSFRAKQVAIGSDGIWVAGEDSATPPTSWKLQRFVTALGAADPTFNSGEPVTTTIDPPGDLALVSLTAEELVLQAGKPIIAGTATYNPLSEGDDIGDFVLGRYTTAGANDTTFGDSGGAVIDVGNNETLRAMTLQGDNKIVIAGSEVADESELEVAVLARLTADGDLDSDFALGAGFLVEDEIGHTVIISDVSLRLAHRIVGLGMAFDDEVILAGMQLSDNVSLHSEVIASIAYQANDVVSGGWVLDGFGGLSPVSIGDGRFPVCPDGPSFAFDIANDATLIPGTRQILALDGYGGVHGVGPGLLPTPPPTNGPYFGFDIARAIALRDDEGGYVLDGRGGLHRLAIEGGTAPAGALGPYFGFDIARDFAFMPNGVGGYLLDGYGGIHPFAVGGNPKPPAITDGPYFGFDIAEKLVLNEEGTGGYLLDGYGGLHPFSIGDNQAPPATSGPYFGFDIARDFVLEEPGESGGYILDGFGGIHPVVVGNADEAPPSMDGPYFGFDIARALLLMEAPPAGPDPG